MGDLKVLEVLEKLEALEKSKVIFRNLTTIAEMVLVLVSSDQTRMMWLPAEFQCLLSR